MEIEGTKILEDLMGCDSRIVILRGGARAGKSYALCQLFLLKALSEKNKRFIVVRKSFNTLRRTIYSDFINILNDMDVKDMFNLNRTNFTLTCYRTGSVIEFVSADDPQKFRGLEANYFLFNEATEIEYGFFEQAILRMSRKTDDGNPNQFYLDFNPSDSNHWLRVKVENEREDCSIFVSTFRDNPYLSDDSIQEIERLQFSNPDAWAVYGNGQWGIVRGQIFTNWELIDDAFFKTISFSQYWHGLDFGFNDYTACAFVGLHEGNIYIDEVVYKRGMTNSDLAFWLGKRIDKSSTIIADSANPASIQELAVTYGFNGIYGVKKYPNSIVEGINMLKGFKMYVTKSSTNIIMELENYKWLENKNGDVTTMPIDKYNHSIDAIRYVALEKLSQGAAPFSIKIRTVQTRKNENKNRYQTKF